MRGIIGKKLMGFVAFFVVIITLSACNSSEEVVEEVVETPVAVAEAFTGKLSGSNKLTGVAKPGSDIIVMPKSAGQIVELTVSRGDYVEAGQTLARLESKDQQLALEAEKSGLRQAQNGLERAQNGLAKAKTALNEAEQGHEITLKNLEMELENAERQLDTVTLNLERMEILYKEGVIPLQQLEEVQTGFNAAEDGLERVKLQLEQEKEGFTIERLEAGIRDAKTAVSDAQVGVEQRKISVELAQKRLSEVEIKTPIAGQISQLDFEVGEFVSNQTSFARVISDEYIDIEVSVSADQLLMFEIGDKVAVEVAGVAGTIDGEVTYIALAADQTGLFKVEVQVVNLDKQFRSGMVATINVEEVLVAESLIVPTAAVIERQDVTYIFNVVDGQAVQKEVEVIRYDTDLTAIIGEINEGDKVVVKGQNLLSDGDVVRIAREEK